MLSAMIYSACEPFPSSKALIRSRCVAIAVMLYPPLRLSALVLAGRSPVCPLKNAMHAEENQKRQIEIKDEILKASKVIKKDEKYEQWQTPKGNYWIAAGSRYVLPFNLAEQQRKIYGAGENFVHPGDVVLDCGANIGVFVRNRWTPARKRLLPSNLRLRTLSAFGATSRRHRPGRVIVYPKGVWDKDDFLTLHIDDHNSAADSFMLHPERSHATDQKFPLTTIDKLVAELNLPSVDFIKMDIEGAEVKALQGGQSDDRQVSSTDGAVRLSRAGSSGGSTEGCERSMVRLHD